MLLERRRYLPSGRPAGTRGIVLAAICLASALAGCDRSASTDEQPQWVAFEDRDPVVVAALLSDTPRVSDTAMQDLRGGFIFSAGSLILRFGLETATTINGELVSSTSLRGAGDLSAQTLIDVAGADVVVSQAMLRDVSGALTIIRNAVPETVIEHVTRITVDVANYSVERTVLLNLARDRGIVQ